MNCVAKIVRVTLCYKWMDEADSADYSCGTLDGAYRFIDAEVARGDVRWWSIESQKYYPCVENDPDGQLYIGVDHFEFHDLEKEDRV